MDVLQGWRMEIEDTLLMVMVILMATWNFLGLFTIERLMEEPVCVTHPTLDFPDVSVG